MEVSYKKLWKLLIDKDMKKRDLETTADIGKSTIAKMTRGEHVSMDVLLRICGALNCNFGDIIDAVPIETEAK
jgi:putative transcriptional regulator